jgi:arginine exporter protein ArgO
VPVIAALLAGAVAGYGIAIPVGAIAILIVETGLRRGFRLAAAAGTGAAAADGIYATVAVVFGAALVTVLAPFETPLRILAMVVLVAIGVRGLLGLRQLPALADDGEAVSISADVEAAERGGSAGRTFAAFLGLTLLNPITVTYFTALILGLTGTGVTPMEKVAFVAGAFVASLSWQLLLAAVGAFLQRRLPPGLRAGVIVLGNAIVLLFALVIAIDLAA